MLLLDYPAEYTKFKAKQINSVLTKMILQREKKSPQYSFMILNYGIDKYSYTKQTVFEKRKPTPAPLKRAMYRKSSKAIGRILENNG